MAQASCSTPTPSTGRKKKEVCDKNIPHTVAHAYQRKLVYHDKCLYV